jgi:hypothetical protein
LTTVADFCVRSASSLGAGLRSLLGRSDAARSGKQPLACAVVSHHLRLFGVRETAPLLLDRPDAATVARIRAVCADGGVVIVQNPTEDFCAGFGITSKMSPTPVPGVLAWAGDDNVPWRRLRSLHPVTILAHPEGIPVVIDGQSEAVWLWLPSGRGGILLIGTVLASDLIRYRQGDPALGAAPDMQIRWGIPGERPNYLFEPQLEGEAPSERHADWWAMALVRALARHAGVTLAPILPDNAVGAVVLTGDDDQAYLEKYDDQLRELGNLPITYFLHPQTKHNRASMARIFAGHRVDLGLHPDALEAPERYDELFAEQAKWYRRLCGSPPLSVRNHGFLNQGYWGHLPTWVRGGVRLSSNLPGVDGMVLNGSLLPARVAWQERLTRHWSVLTAIGDGVVFALGMSPEQSAKCILDLADNIRASGIPGVMVLNLHPQNIAETRAMHRALHHVVKSGFLAWTARECLEWFEGIDIPVSKRRASA